MLTSTLGVLVKELKEKNTFIKMLSAKKPNCKEPLKIIEIINGKEPIYKMIRIYIYKILYYK